MIFDRKPETVEARLFDGTLECAIALSDWVSAEHDCYGRVIRSPVGEITLTIRSPFILDTSGSKSPRPTMESEMEFDVAPGHLVVKEEMPGYRFSSIHPSISYRFYSRTLEVLERSHVPRDREQLIRELAAARLV